MRSTDGQASVRLYHLSADDAAARTLFYGPLSEALQVAAAQDEGLQDDLWLATDNDVVAYRDLVGD